MIGKIFAKSNYVTKKRVHLRNTYGISLEHYNAMLENQGGCCLICDKHQDSFKISLSVDHDHATGRVRGLLCGKCNRAIGLLGDSEQNCKRAREYLIESNLNSKKL